MAWVCCVIWSLLELEGSGAFSIALRLAYAPVQLPFGSVQLQLPVSLMVWCSWQVSYVLVLPHLCGCCLLFAAAYCAVRGWLVAYCCWRCMQGILCVSLPMPGAA
jgi:hypothetical protein